MVDGDSPAFGHGAEQRTMAPPPLLIGVVPVCATVVQIRWDWSLWHQNDEVRPFLLTLCVGGLNKDRVTSGGSVLCYWSMASSLGQAPVPSSLPIAVGVARVAFPSIWWARGVAKQRNQRRGATPRAWSLRQKFEGRWPLFMRLIAPDSSWGKVLMILYLTELNPALVREKSRRGWIPFGYEFFPNLVSGVTLGSVVLGRDMSEATGPGLGHAKMEKGRERRGWSGWAQLLARFRLITK
jgi:hypothetical protein